jgi:glycosyltransferase involved in cell wall biosynthesis
VPALTLKRLTGATFLFDMRGLWPDEKVAAGEWCEDTAVYRAAKSWERRFLLEADAVVSLTHAAADELRAREFLKGRAVRFEVIPTCVDTRLFQAGPGTGRPFTLGYVGSVGGRYRFDAVLDCFELLRKLQPEARLRIINLGAHAAIREALRLRAVPESSVELTSEDRAGVARALGTVDAGILFYHAGFSTLGTAPTRLGEFLAAGVPCLTNAGVGDAGVLLESERIGIVLRQFTEREEQQAMQGLMTLATQPDIRTRCAEVAERTFSLERAADAYDRIYRSLVTPGSRDVGASHEPLEMLHAGH